MNRLTGKVAVVTGAGRGIGAAIARRMASEGARVGLLDVVADAGAATAAEIGDAARFLHVDVTDDAAWARALDEVGDVFGAPDILVNNAGILRYGPLEQVTPAQFREVIDVNLVGTFLGMRAMVPVLRAHGRGGSIVNVSSTCGLHGSPYLAAYTASKWGIRGLTKSAALELAADGIRVNSVHPGGIDTAMVRGDSTDEEVEAMGENIPIGRLGGADDVAGLVAYLASPEAAYCTGGEYAIDGGYTAGDLSMVRWTRENRLGSIA
jgi:3alpha(or 20beta)-hydroxysteroid dehydrogenase